MSTIGSFWLEELHSSSTTLHCYSLCVLPNVRVFVRCCKFTSRAQAWSTTIFHGLTARMTGRRARVSRYSRSVQELRSFANKAMFVVSRSCGWQHALEALTCYRNFLFSLRFLKVCQEISITPSIIDYGTKGTIQITTTTLRDSRKTSIQLSTRMLLDVAGSGRVGGSIF